jgi:flagellar basal-body rod modification protein FlgD
MSVSDISSTASTATDRGTQINTSGSNGLDRNAFLKILTTELSNQDPSTPTDSTQYVAQLAQFSSLEQMQNLNDTMTFNGATGIIGKNVNLNVVDSNNALYTGLVKGVFKNSNGVFIHLQLTDKAGNTSIEDFPYANVAEVIS